MTIQSELTYPDRVDPDIRRFVDLVNAAYAEHATGDPADLAGRRRIAERVRERWRAGGPAMHEVRDFAAAGLRMRLYLPKAQPRLPAMIYVHGGGWTLFSIDTHDRLMREYAARAGVAVIGFDYSLSPEHKYPVALEEVAGGIDWVLGDADRLGIDPARVLIGGDSAGANLSVTASLLRRERGRPPLAGMVLNYGAFDPEPTESYDRYGGAAFPLSVDEMDDFWANYVTAPAQLRDPLVAPLRADLAGLPPTFVAIAECDILAGCNRAFAHKLAAAGVAVEAITYRGATHSFLEAVSIAPLAARAIEDQATWIRSIVGG
ncbi:alpha/beta hydrolase [Sphingomonas bacterium]|uniref:alpha/beta hydrolase n=1 Tax=Sphingomonas bacterium TaxID=1895847 RepID=UPI001C2D97A5|nr:alpha/beta hydrolase [Sphingomonas bacterium]